MELEITWGRATRIWWSYLWRNLIAIFVAMLLGGILGFILGAVMGALGVSTSTIQTIVAPIGFVIGLGVSIVPMKMILGKNFGQFRLVLVSTQPSVNTPASEA